MKRITQTRFKLSLIGLALFFIEAIVKTVFGAFPLVEIISAESGVIIGISQEKLSKIKRLSIMEKTRRK